MRRLARRLAAARAGTGGDSRQRLQVTVETLVWTFASEPKAARLCLIEIFAAGPPGLERMRRASVTLDSAIRDGLTVSGDGVAVPEELVKGLIGGLMGAVRSVLLRGREAELHDLADRLVEWALSCCGARLPRARPLESPATGVEETYEEGGWIGNERMQIVTAAKRLAAGGGYRWLTVPRICSTAGVSGKTFADHFEEVDECFFDAAELVLVEEAKLSLRRGAVGRGWAGKVYRTIGAFCERVARDPDLVRVGLLEILAPGAEGVRRRERLIEIGAETLRRSAPAGVRLGKLEAETSLGAVWGTVNHHVFRGGASCLPHCAAGLSFLILAPALGPRTASQAIEAELDRDREELAVVARAG